MYCENQSENQEFSEETPSRTKIQGVAESVGRSKSAVVKYSGREAEGIRGNSGERSSSEFQGVAESEGRSKSAIFRRDEVSYENPQAKPSEFAELGTSKICGGEAVVNSDELRPEYFTNCPYNFETLFSMALQTEPAHTSTIPVSIYHGFKLPIEYVDTRERFQVSKIVSADLEMIPDASATTMYDFLCKPSNVFSKQLIREIHQTYTTNTPFLEETQTVLTEMNAYTVANPLVENGFTPNPDTFLSIWKDLKEDVRFMEQYSFIDWSMLEYLNHSSDFLQLLSVVNIFSPLLSLLVPIVFLIFPFALLRLRGIEITFDQYIETLKDISKNHFIGKALNVQFTVEGILYFGFTAGLYFLQTYQNVMSCHKYYTNISKMNTHLIYIHKHITRSVRSMDWFAENHATKPTYALFCKDVSKNANRLREIASTLESITPFSHTFTKFNSVGYMLQCYYQLHQNAEYEKSIRYSVGFQAYMDILTGIHENLQAGHLGKAQFVKDSEAIFESQYYPPHLSETTRVKNNCTMAKNIIITGVNASGKTTFLKTTAINIIVSQQFGVGFYSKCTIHPYTHIHSYLNIPDTSGRDSLFQAESRRCKEIIDIIESTRDDPTVRHFTIFDELYSGTNPVEATKSATSLLRYLSKFDNVRFMLTTHYISVCKKFRKSTNVRNYKMNVEVDGTGRITYLYTLKRGISKTQGGVEILKMMNYPEEILQDIRDSQIYRVRKA